MGQLSKNTGKSYMYMYQTLELQQNLTELKKERQIHNYSWMAQHPFLSTIDRTIRQIIRRIQKNPTITYSIRNHSTFVEHSTQTIAEYTSFSSVHKTYKNVERILNNKANLKNFTRPEIIHNVFSDHNRIKLETITER